MLTLKPPLIDPRDFYSVEGTTGIDELTVYTCPANTVAVVEFIFAGSPTTCEMDTYLYDPAILSNGSPYACGNWHFTHTFWPQETAPRATSANTYPNAIDYMEVSGNNFQPRKFIMTEGQYMNFKSSGTVSNRIVWAIEEKAMQNGFA